MQSALFFFSAQSARNFLFCLPFSSKILLNKLETKYQLKTPFHFEVLKGKFIDSRLAPKPRNGSFDNNDHEPGGAFIFIPK